MTADCVSAFLLYDGQSPVKTPLDVHLGAFPWRLLYSMCWQAEASAAPGNVFPGAPGPFSGTAGWIGLFRREPEPTDFWERFGSSQFKLVFSPGDAEASKQLFVHKHDAGSRNHGDASHLSLPATRKFRPVAPTTNQRLALP